MEFYENEDWARLQTGGSFDYIPTGRQINQRAGPNAAA
jgi:hypothetical protein